MAVTEFRIKWTKAELFLNQGLSFAVFAQRMANRLICGACRYGKRKPRSSARYLTRLKAELEAYERTGNTEHLVNTANYCMLETEWPEREGGNHWKEESISVTRDILGMYLDGEER